MIWLIFTAHMALAQQMAPAQNQVNDQLVDRYQTTHDSLVETEKQQRETLAHLYMLNKQIKETSRKNVHLNDQMVRQEASVRSLAQDVARLENLRDEHRDRLNRRLRLLYQELKHNPLAEVFSAKTPVEMERSQRFLRLIVDSDHKQLHSYLEALHELREKRAKLKGMVTQLAQMQHRLRQQEEELNRQLSRKSEILASLKKAKEIKISELKEFRDQHAELSDVLSYAFFERKGSLHAPLKGVIEQGYGTVVDPQYRFRLMHKGLFYAAKPETEVHAVFGGRVALARLLPGYGKTVILDHGDNYYSVYAFASEIKVKRGQVVREGDVLSLSGETSPLFGPGLYFEIRHFADAIDPAPWIKESGMRRAL